MNNQMDSFAAAWAPIILPFFFIGFWLFITTTLAVMSGWFGLRARYPDTGEEPLVRRRVGSASMGLGVHLRGMVTLAACPGGLRISVNRLMAPFQRPLLIPWNEIEAEDARSFFEPVVRLRLGRPQIGRLTIGVRDWEAIRDHAGGPVASLGSLKTERVSSRAIGAGLLLQWAIFTLAAGTFFFAGPRLMQDGAPQLPIWLCYAFPGVAFGIGQTIRWISQLR